MRRRYIDNIRWTTVVLVVFYHVIFLYSAIEPELGLGPFRPVQYQDAFPYIVYPWFMALLFVVSGISSRLYLESHTGKEYLGSRTRKLLVPSTLGLFVFQWIQGCTPSVGNSRPGPLSCWSFPCGALPKF